MTIPAWYQTAAGADGTVEPDWFFPAVGHDGTKAREVCAGCQVREQCLAVALRQPVAGIWGGTTEPERVAMRRELGIHLPQRWAARKHRSPWEDRYQEMVELGYNQLEIADRWGIQPQSMQRQLNRYGLPVSALLQAKIAAAKAEERAS